MGQSQKAKISKEKKCEKCGYLVSAKAKFCTQCGSKISLKTIEFLKVSESLEERQLKEQVFAKLKSFLDPKYNPSKQDIAGVFAEINEQAISVNELQDILVQLLEHPFKLLREKAAFLLVQEKDGLQKIMDILEGGPAWLKTTAVQALGRMRAKKAVPLLLYIYEREKDLWLKQEILYAFCEIADPQPFNTLIKALKAQEPELVIGAAIALKAIADPAAIEYLVPIMESSDQKVVNSIQEVIQSFDKKAVKILVNILMKNQVSKKSKQNILEILAKLPDSMAVPLLINLIHQKDELVLPIIKIMGAWKYSEFIIVLENLQGSPQRECRLEAQIALKNIKSSLS